MIGKILTITSGKGGVGKSTMSVNIGKGFSNLGYKTLLIDLDIGLKNLDILLNVEEETEYDIIDLMNNEVSIENSCTEIEKNLFYLSASQKYDKTYLDENKINNLLISLKRNFDIILIDSPAGIESGFIHSIEISDEIILVVNPDMASIRDADRVRGLIGKYNKNIQNKFDVNTSLIINKYPTNDENHIKYSNIVDILGEDLYGIIPYSDNMMYYYNNGIPAIEYNSFLQNMVKRLERKIILDDDYYDIINEIPIDYDSLNMGDNIEIYKKIQKAQKKVIDNLEITLKKSLSLSSNKEIELIKKNEILKKEKKSMNQKITKMKNIIISKDKDEDKKLYDIKEKAKLKNNVIRKKLENIKKIFMVSIMSLVVVSIGSIFYLNLN